MGSPSIADYDTDIDASPIDFGTYAMTLPSTPSTGSTLVLAVCQLGNLNAIATSIDDGQSGVWVKLNTLMPSGVYQSHMIELWVCYSAPAGIATLTATYDNVTTHEVHYHYVELTSIKDASCQSIRVRDLTAATERTWDTDYVDGVTQIAATESNYVGLLFVAGNGLGAINGGFYTPPIITVDSPWSVLQYTVEPTPPAPSNESVYTLYKIESSITNPETATVQNDHGGDYINGIMAVLDDIGLPVEIPAVELPGFGDATDDITPTNANAADNYITNPIPGMTILIVNNNDASSKDVTVGGVAGQKTWNDVKENTYTIAAGKRRAIGPFDPAVYNQSDGTVNVSVDDTTDVSYIAVRLPLRS